VQLRLGTRLRRLVLDQDGRVRGGAAELGSGAEREVRARSVVLATGGFQGNPDLAAAHLGTEALHAYHRANAFSRGDGLLAATAAGAAVTTGMDSFYGHSMPDAITPSPADFARLTQYYGSRSVAIDMTGRRFTDESHGVFEENTNWALAQRPGATGFYILDDRLMRERFDPFIPAPAEISRQARTLGATVLTAGSLAELADQLAEHGLPRDVVIAALSGTTPRSPTAPPACFTHHGSLAGSS
jgi:hypothetical protein